ncbi:MAG: hypothetical protein J6P94_04070 [Oscillospiraceae bacterium]|nr:hypothetical protein [Oscillospiraceae bacterium]
MKKRKVILIVALALLLVFGLLAADSACRIVVSEHTMESESLPESFDGFTVAHLSDIHGRCFGRDNARLVEK